MMVALMLASAAAVVLAWALTQRRREHRPIALLLSAGLALDAAQLALDARVLAPLRAELGVAVPWTGWARVAGHLADALWLGWGACLVAAALVVFAGRKPWPALAGWAGVVAALVVVHPVAGDGSQARALSAAAALWAVVSVGLLVAWYRRATKPPTSAQFALAMIVTVEPITLSATWWAGLLEHWALVQVSALLLFGALILQQGRLLWTTQPSS